MVERRGASGKKAPRKGVVRVAAPCLAQHERAVSSRGSQQVFAFCDAPLPTVPPKKPRGGARKNAGRKAAVHRKGFEVHGVRPDLNRNHPVHIVMRAKPNAPRFRQERISRAIRRRIASAARRGFQIIHFSIQQNHLHLVVEAEDRKLLWRGIQRLAQRLAWDINALTHRHGSLWRDRYTRRDLTSPRQVRNALVYVLMNFRKHALDEIEFALASMTLDPCSSALWFDGWHTRAGPFLDMLRREFEEAKLPDSPVSAPRTWLARIGWKRHGTVLPTEHPRVS